MVESAKITVKFHIGKGEYAKYAVEVTSLLRYLSGVVAMHEWRRSCHYQLIAKYSAKYTPILYVQRKLHVSCDIKI